MIKPDSPLRLTIPTNTSVSLKNGRSLVMIKGKPRLIVKANVRKAMNSIRAAAQRQLYSQCADFEIIESGIAIVSLIHVFYKSPFPKSDIDNFHTTFQECLQELVVNDDRQIEYFLPVRQRALKREHEFIDSFIWTTQGDWLNELPLFMDYYKGLKNESRFAGTDQDNERTVDEAVGTRTVTDWF